MMVIRWQTQLKKMMDLNTYACMLDMKGKKRSLRRVHAGVAEWIVSLAWWFAVFATSFVSCFKVPGQLHRVDLPGLHPCLEDHPMTCKWLIPMVIVGPLSMVNPLPNGLNGL